jgi:hypothetical protein
MGISTHGEKARARIVQVPAFLRVTSNASDEATTFAPQAQAQHQHFVLHPHRLHRLRNLQLRHSPLCLLHQRRRLQMCHLHVV